MDSRGGSQNCESVIPFTLEKPRYDNSDSDTIYIYRRKVRPTGPRLLHLFPLTPADESSKKKRCLGQAREPLSKHDPANVPRNCDSVIPCSLERASHDCGSDTNRLGVRPLLLCMFPRAQPCAQPQAPPPAQPRVQPPAQPRAEPCIQPAAQLQAQPHVQPAAQPGVQHGPRAKSSPFKGVTYYKRTGRWKTQIWKYKDERNRGKQIYLGASSTPNQAARAYDRAAIYFRGVNAEINFLLSDYHSELPQLQALTRKQLLDMLRKQSAGKGTLHPEYPSP